MAVSNLRSLVPNFEIEERLVFIPTKKFTKKFLENCIVSEVAYLYPYDSESCKNSTTTTIFRKCNGKCTLTVKTSDGDKNTDTSRYEHEIEISEEEYEAFTKKLFKMEFRYYKDKNGYEFKVFGNPENHQIKVIVEKEFYHEITAAEQIEMINYISQLGHDVYLVIKNFTFIVKQSIQKSNEIKKKTREK